MSGQLRLPAVYMRGGTSKGVFFHARDLPADPAARDRLLLRVIGSRAAGGVRRDPTVGLCARTTSISSRASSRWARCITR